MGLNRVAMLVETLSFMSVTKLTFKILPFFPVFRKSLFFALCANFVI